MHDREGMLAKNDDNEPIIKGAFNQYLAGLAILGVAALWYFFVMNATPDTRGAKSMLLAITIGPFLLTIVLFVQLRKEKKAKANGKIGSGSDTP